MNNLIGRLRKGKMVDVSSDWSSTEATLERIKNNSSVQELLIFDDNNGAILQSTMDTARSQTIRNHLSPLCYSARNAIKGVDPTDDLKFIRIRTQTNEIIIAPDQYATLTVFQQVNPF